MYFSQVKKVLIITFFLNWLVAAAKILIGVWTGALSVLIDGLHSFFDGSSNILGFWGVDVAERPKDPGHPYGHRKFESLASLGIAVLIGIVGYELLKDIIGRLFHPFIPQINFLSFLVVGAAFLIDLCVYLYESNRGRKLKSQILTADAIHTKSHLITTPSVMLGMVAIKLGFPIIDPIIAFLVLVMLGKLAWEIVADTTAILCDQSFINEEQIKKIAQRVEGVLSSHQVRTRGDSHHVFLDMHITLKPELSLEKAHGISHQLKEQIMRDIPQIKDVVIHIEPE